MLCPVQVLVRIALTRRCLTARAVNQVCDGPIVRIVHTRDACVCKRAMRVSEALKSVETLVNACNYVRAMF